MKKDVTYILHHSVFYSIVNERVALYYTASAMLYTFNAFSKVIFDFFRKESTLQSLFDFLEREYGFDAEDPESVSGVEAFIEELVRNRILIRPGKVFEYPGLLENNISDEFTDSRKLFSATIELTYRCNEKCRHCYVYDECGDELTTEQVKTVLDDLSRMGVLSVVFTGGEVFVRKDIFEILEYAYQKHFAVDLR